MTEVYPRFKTPKAPKKGRERNGSDRPGMSAKHLAMIRALPSCLSGKTPCEAHHLRCAGGRGVALKAEDRYALPLTMEEHRDVHRVGSKKEFAWFESRNVNCLELAKALWESNYSEDAMRAVLAAHRGTG